MRGFKLAVVVAAGLAMAACSGSAHPAASPGSRAAGGSLVPAAAERASVCAHATATAATSAPVAEGLPGAPRVGPITFHTTPYQPPLATKVLIHRVGVFTGSLSLTGYNCRDGRPLRFWYCDCGGQLPVPLDRRPGEGFRVAVLRFYPPPVTDYTGYMLFTEPGRWNIVVSHGMAAVGNIVITVASGLRPVSSAAPGPGHRFALLGHVRGLGVYGARGGDSCPPAPLPVSSAQASEAGRAALAVLGRWFSPRAVPPVNVTEAYVKLRRLAFRKSFPYRVARTECGTAVLRATVFVFVVLPREEKVSASAANEWFYVARTSRGWAVWGSYS